MAFPIAVVQLALEPGEPDRNRQRVLDLVARAISGGARLVVLPEACISDIYRGVEILAETIPGPSTELFMRAAGNAAVLLPLLEKTSGGTVYSACALITKDGVKGVARKTHLFRDPSGLDSFADAEVLSAGSELVLLQFEDIQIGVLLGFDAEFSECFRTLALRGADLIVASLNTLAPDAAFLSAMALRNRTPVFAANRLGFKRVYPTVPEFTASLYPLVQEKPGAFLTRCRGGSVIIDAAGNRVAEPTVNQQRDLERIAGLPPQAVIPVAHFQEDEVLMASFKLDELRVQRLTSPYLAGRRPDLYEK